MSVPLLKLVEIEKSFFSIQVLKKVSWEIAAGTVLGVVGENGAGKSTLMNIIGGTLLPDRGEMRWRDQRYSPRSPLDAHRVGITYIHQELNLFGNLSVAENLFLTNFPRKGVVIDAAKMLRRSQDLLQRVGLSLSPKTLVEQLSPGERQLVEIAKGLNQQARLMILDEPTTSLTDRETRALFALLAALKQEGMALVYISHTLDDVLSISDRILVLRDGAVVDQGPKTNFTTKRLVSLMVGRELDQQYPAVPPEACQTRAREVMLSVSGLTRKDVIERISFDLHRGEILGVAGLMGSGRTELARLLFGLDRNDQGTIFLEGERVDGQALRKRITKGLAFVTESRREDGLCMAASIDDNLSLVSAPRYTRWFGALRRRTLALAMNAIRQGVQLTSTAAGTSPVRTLSGGNQQKIVLGKWLLNQPKVLILDEPTRGIDVGAKSEIYRQMVNLAQQGVAILLISSELEELLGICHRVLVMSQGHVCDELKRSEFHRERILRAALQAHTARGAP